MCPERNSSPQRVSQVDCARASHEQALPLLQSSDAQHDWLHRASPVAFGPNQPSDIEPLRPGVSPSKSEDPSREELATKNQEGNLIPRFERRPIRGPNDIQGHGTLIALDATDPNGEFAVLVVSENVERTIGRTPEELFALQSFVNILEDDQANKLVDRINSLKGTTAKSSTNDSEVFSLRIVSASRRPPSELWCVLHIVAAAQGNMIICDFESDDRNHHPWLPNQNFVSDHARNVGSESLPYESCVPKPQTVTRTPKTQQNRIRGRRHVNPLRILEFMSSIEARLAAAPDLTTLSEALVKIVEELTGFERVMIHRLDGSSNGQMFTDFVNPSISQYVEKLSSPIEDVPLDFRKPQTSRGDQLLHDRKSPNARLLYRASDATKPPLDLTRSYLRVMSRLRMAHAKHLDVRSLMSISIDLPTGMWGSIVCHSYGTTVTRTSFSSRTLCRFVSNVAARSIQSLLSKWHIQAWKDLDRVFSNGQMNQRSVATSDNLLRLFQADFGVLTIGPRTKILGHIHHTQEALVLLEYFRMFGTRSMAASFDVNRDFPKLKYVPIFKGIAEILVIPVVDKSGGMILLFRGPRSPSQEQPGGSSSDSGLISHKRSTWTERQMEAATVLCSMPDEVIRAWAEEDALPLSRMTQLLLDNISHDIRTPLNAIVNYLEVALEGPLDSETRKLLSASRVTSEDLIRAVMEMSRTFEVSSVGHAVATSVSARSSG